MRDVGSGNRDVVHDGEPDSFQRLSLHRAAATRRARFVSRRGFRRSLSRGVLASVPVQRLAADYHVGAHEHCLRAVVLRRHTQRDEHLEGHIARAGFRYTRPQHGSADKPARVLASFRWTERDGSFKSQPCSGRLLHAVYPEF
jgi:hypothetical protein